MDDTETFDDLLEELTANVNDTLAEDGHKISARWTWGNEYHIYWDNGSLKNWFWKNYIVIVAPQFELDSGNIRRVSVDVYTPKILADVKQIFEKYKDCYRQMELTEHFDKST